VCSKDHPTFKKLNEKEIEECLAVIADKD